MEKMEVVDKKSDIFKSLPNKIIKDPSEKMKTNGINNKIRENGTHTDISIDEEHKEEPEKENSVLNDKEENKTDNNVTLADNNKENTEFNKKSIYNNTEESSLDKEAKSSEYKPSNEKDNEAEQKSTECEDIDMENKDNEEKTVNDPDENVSKKVDEERNDNQDIINKEEINNKEESSDNQNIINKEEIKNKEESNDNQNIINKEEINNKEEEFNDIKESVEFEQIKKIDSSVNETAKNETAKEEESNPVEKNEEEDIEDIIDHGFQDVYSGKTSQLPDFAVIISFLEMFGNSLELPYVSITDLEESIDTTKDLAAKEVEGPLEILHAKLLRKLLKSQKLSTVAHVKREKLVNYILKFCQLMDMSCAWDLEQFGYHILTSAQRLHILKALCEVQFEENFKFRNIVQETYKNDPGTHLRLIPFGYEQEGLNVWFQQDKDLNIRVYAGEEDDGCGDTWKIRAGSMDDLEFYISKLKARSEVNPKDIAVEKIKEMKIIKVEEKERRRAERAEKRRIREEKMKLETKGKKTRKSRSKKKIEEVIPSDEQSTGDESEQEDDGCARCYSNNQSDLVILCDSCDAAYHSLCLRPPVTDIPEGDWFCPFCQQLQLVDKLQQRLNELRAKFRARERKMDRSKRLVFYGINDNNILGQNSDDNLTRRSSRNSKRVDYKFTDYDETMNEATSENSRKRRKNNDSSDESETRPSRKSSRDGSRVQRRKLTDLSGDENGYSSGSDYNASESDSGLRSRRKEMKRFLVDDDYDEMEEKHRNKYLRRSSRNKSKYRMEGKRSRGDRRSLSSTDGSASDSSMSGYGARKSRRAKNNTSYKETFSDESDVGNKVDENDGDDWKGVKEGLPVVEEETESEEEFSNGDENDTIKKRELRKSPKKKRKRIIDDTDEESEEEIDDDIPYADESDGKSENEVDSESDENTAEKDEEEKNSDEENESNNKKQESAEEIEETANKDVELDTENTDIVKLDAEITGRANEDMGSINTPNDMLDSIVENKMPAENLEKEIEKEVSDKPVENTKLDNINETNENPIHDKEKEKEIVIEQTKKNGNEDKIKIEDNSMEIQPITENVTSKPKELSDHSVKANFIDLNSSNSVKETLLALKKSTDDQKVDVNQSAFSSVGSAPNPFTPIHHPRPMHPLYRPESMVRPNYPYGNQYEMMQGQVRHARPDMYSPTTQQHHFQRGLYNAPPSHPSSPYSPRANPPYYFNTQQQKSPTMERLSSPSHSFSSIPYPYHNVHNQPRPYSPASSLYQPAENINALPPNIHNQPRPYSPQASSLYQAAENINALPPKKFYSSDPAWKNPTTSSDNQFNLPGGYTTQNNETYNAGPSIPNFSTDQTNSKESKKQAKINAKQQKELKKQMKLQEKELKKVSKQYPNYHPTSTNSSAASSMSYFKNMVISPNSTPNTNSYGSDEGGRFSPYSKH